MSSVYDTRRCELGEGPLWHPARAQLFWFDILAKTLHTVEAGQPKSWTFDAMVSAAGWVGRDEMLIASERALLRFDLATGQSVEICPLEADNPLTRSNDGRADPQGGFWIGTMGKQAQSGAGAIYRFYKGEMRKIFGNITISNAISFAPDGKTAHFADTVTGQVMRVGLDAEGWPIGTPEVFLDLRAEGLNPDGAVVDADGLLWLAQWGAARVAAYAPDGSLVRSVAFDAPHTSCPAFGGADGRTLFCTTALQGMDEAARKAQPQAGMTFFAPSVALGQKEHQVIL